MTAPRWVLPLALSVALAPSPSGSARTTQAVNPAGAAVLEFHTRVAAYVKVHQQAESQVPKLGETSDPSNIARREVALGEAIRQRRAGAQPGDVFCEAVRPVLAKAIQQDFVSRSRVDRKAIIQELPPSFSLTVNMTYPSTIPLATVPAKLLRALPDLPPQLEYRIVGRHLILRDVKANIVVDYLKDVVPTIPS